MSPNEALHHGYHTRGYLPHIKHEGASYFVTFRLADSLPAEALAELERELADLRFAPATPAAGVQAERHRERRRRFEVLLDHGAGSCRLREATMAQLVENTLRYHHGERYQLEAWVVMPNHVHVLLRPLNGFTLSQIVKSWKQFISTHGKRLSESKADRFWQPEAYDHWVRDEADGARIVRYIERNPVKAGLCANPQDFRWSSAYDAGRSSADFQSAPAEKSIPSRLEVCATPCIVPPAPMIQLIYASVFAPDTALPVVILRTDRRTLAKRLWRGTAADGVEFGFELSAPLQPGATFHQSATHRYVIEQTREPVLEIPLANMPPSAAAGIGWAVGNLHLEFASEADRLLTPDEPAARQLLARIQIEYLATSAVFRPGRFKRSPLNPALDDLGPSHKH